MLKCIEMDIKMRKWTRYTKESFTQKKMLRIGKNYIGISSTKWKSRCANHKFSFSHEDLKNQTALSKHFWSLKNKGLTPEIQWSILKKSNTPKCFDRRCNLCLQEKIQIVIYPDPEKLLDQRCELIARCRNRNKLNLKTN